MIPFLRFARDYLARYWHWYLGGVLALLATNWLSVSIPVYLAEGIDALGQPDGRAVILRSALVVGAMGIVLIAVRTASRLLFFTPGRLVEAQVKHDLFEKLIRHQPSFLDRWPTGDLISRVSSDVNMLRLLGGFTALGIANTVIAIGMTSTQMARLDPVLAAWVVLPLLVGFLVTLGFVRQFRALMQQMQEQAGELSDHILSSYQGAPTIHAFRAEAAFQQAFRQRNEAYLRTMIKRANLGVAIGPVLSFASSFNVFVLLFVGGPRAIRGEITVGELVAFTTLVAYLTGPLRGMSFIISLVKQAQASLERIEAILLAPVDRPDLPNPTPAPEAPPALSVRGLSFAYPDDPDHIVLRDVSFDLPAGATLGILGPTGSGKSTLLRVLARLYNPPRGTVFVDGTDILDIDLDAWRRQMALVPQRAFLFSERVRDNVLLGAPDDGRLERVLGLAQLEVDMAALPQGVDTVVGESGLTLSGGQRQRVALARGLVRENSVLVLDDVLSAVDHATEQALIAAIRSGRRPTTLIVANRISALQHADLVLVMEGGTVVDRGRHEELVAREGLYRDTWLRQSETNE